MRFYLNNNNVAIIDGQEVEDMDSFDYLGGRITKHGGAVDDIIRQEPHRESYRSFQQTSQDLEE